MDEHSSLVANGWNLNTGYISSKYHIVFEMVMRQRDDDVTVDAICNDLFDIDQAWYAKEETNSDENLFYRPPPICDVCIDEQGRRDKICGLEQLIQRR